MKKNANFPILIVVIALVAVVAQFTRHSGEKPEWTALRQDLVQGLVRLWDRPKQEVEFLPGNQGLVVRAMVSMPDGLRQRQQRWNYPFLRFIAERHPKAPIEQLEVIDSASRREVSEIALNGLLAEAAYSPARSGEDEERNSALMSRLLTTGLEESLGRGEALVLVDAQRASSQLYRERYGKVAFRRPGPMPAESFHYDVCVVSRGPIPEEKWQQFFASHLNHGESIRKVTLQ